MATPAIKPVFTESSSCSGFPPDTYDRYVLGLLDGRERTEVELHIEQQCPVCIGGVQRSMNLWLVFANSLEQTEPAADFRARLVRIAELSKRVLTVPKRHKRVREPAILISSLVMICLILVTLLIFTWIAGRQSARMDVERTNAELARMASESAESKVNLQRQVDLNRTISQKLDSSGVFAVRNQKRMEESVVRANAEIEQYKQILTRYQQQTADNDNLVGALSAPGARLLTFKSADATSSAYAIVGNSKIIFVASNLTLLPENRQYQLWLVRKDEPHYVSAGVLSLGADKTVALLTFEDKEAIANLAGLVLTDEQENGSSAPSGTKVMETPGMTASIAATSAPE